MVLVTKEYIKSIKGEVPNEYSNEVNKNFFINEIAVIREFYKNSSVFERRTLYTFDSRIRYWFLENNILLDANAGFHYGYKINNKFCVINQQRIVDHSRWKVHICDINTTKSAKGRYVDFYDVIQKHIEENRRNNDKILVLGNKNEVDNINVVDISKSYFGNIIGKNDWWDYNKLYIIHTPNIPFYMYVLKYLYYSGKKFDGRHRHNLKNKDRVMTFSSDELDNVRKRYLVGELYQAIKRIDRNVNLDVDIYIINNDKDVIKGVLKQLNNAEIDYFNLEIESVKKERKEYDNLKRRNDSFARKFIELLKCLSKGNYYKRWCMDKIGYKDVSNFSKIILNDEEVIKYLKDNPHITVTTRKIIVSENERATA